jgi:hypothetical protein
VSDGLNRTLRQAEASRGASSGFSQWRVGFAPINSFISATERTEAALDFIDEPESRAGLFFPRVPAQGTVQADFGQSPVQAGGGVRIHYKNGARGGS